MPTYRKITTDLLGITPDEYEVTRAQIDQQKMDSEQAQVIYDREADASQAELQVQLDVLNS